ncbi:MAG: acyltransferase [Clostridiales bacterium]|nr:acyltransferase [Clostridiales bacterium]
MRSRKILSVFITVLLLVVSFSAAFPMADEEGRTFELPEGITVTLPADFAEVYWVGMSENDSEMTKQYGVQPILDLYDEEGVALQGEAPPVGADNGQIFFVMVHVKDAPSDLSEDTFIANVPENEIDSPESLENMEILKKGVIRSGDMDLYKTTSDLTVNFEGHARYKLRTNKYSFISEAGKLYEIEIQLVSSPENPDVPFTEEDLSHLEYLESYIIGSVKLEGKTVSIDAEPFPTSKNENISQQGEEPSSTEKPESETSAPKKVKKTFFQSFTTFEFPIWLIACGMMLLLFLGAKVSKRHEWQEEPLSLSTSKGIQGFAAVAIILHHLSQELVDKAGPLEFLSGCGVLFVGIFFFFSGYGLYTSLKNKENYLKGFLKKRYVAILVPFYMCILVFTLALCACGTKLKGWEILRVLSGWTLINTHMWYIVEIAILYLVFFILYRLIKNRTAATILMTVFVLAMIGGSLWLCHGKDFSCRYWFMGEWWYNASFLFIVGILVSKHAEILTKFARKAYVVLLPLFAGLTWFLGVKTNDALNKYSYWSEIPGETRAIGDKLRCLSVQLPWIMCFVIFLLLVMMKVRFGNPILKFLGSVSLELYLLHNLFLVGLHDGSIFRVSSPSMYILLTILLAVGLATVVSGLDKYIIALIAGKKREDLKLDLSGKSRIHSIDVMRGIMAFLVVAIHWPFDGKAGDVFITFGKTAVPFFLVVCGYLLFREDGSEMMNRLKKQTKRIFLFFVLANAFYIGMYALYSHKMSGSWTDFKACFKVKPIMNFLLYNYPLYSEHLWYLGSLLYALLILMLLHKLKVLKYAMYLAPALVAAYVVLAHMGIGEFYQLRNAIFIGLGYTMMGMLIRRYEKKILGIKHIGAILLILFAVCSFAAIYELNHYTKGTAVPFIGAEIMTYVIVLLCLRFPNFGIGTFAEKFGREYSLPIYIMHIAVIQTLLMTKNDPFFGRIGAVMVFVITAFIVSAYENIKKAVLSTKAKAPA